MRTVHKVLLAGIAATGLAGLAQPAAAHDPAVHELTIRLPNGGTERIRYTGDVPPQVAFDSGAAPGPVFAPMPPSTFWPAALWPAALWQDMTPAGFRQTGFRQIWADMDRHVTRLMRRAEAMAMAPGGASEAAFADMPPGSVGYAVVSIASGNGVCTRTTRLTSAGRGAKPEVVSRTRGDCGALPGDAGSASGPATLSRPGTTTIDVKAEGARSGIDPSLLHPATAHRYE